MGGKLKMLWCVWQRKTPEDQWEKIMTLPVEIASFVFVMAAGFHATLTLALIPDMLGGSIFESFNENTQRSCLVAPEIFDPNKQRDTASAKWN